MTVEQAVGHELEWRQPEVLSRFYQLTDNGREIATLRFESSCGSLATGECGQARWTFKRTGFLSPKDLRARSRLRDQHRAIHARLDGQRLGGLLFRPALSLAAHEFRGTEWAFEAEDGTAAIALLRQSRFLQAGRHGHCDAIRGRTARDARDASADLVSARADEGGRVGPCGSRRLQLRSIYASVRLPVVARVFARQPAAAADRRPGEHRCAVCS